MSRFATIRELKSWLRARQIDYEKWGTNATKTVEHLWAEIKSGESRLQADPPRRLVEIIQVFIYRENRILIEVAQEFANGQRRSRGSPPSEKIHPGESYVAAARRCLAEELGITGEESVILPDTYRKKVKEHPSRSFPGLMTQYVLHRLDAQAPTLPGGSFSTAEGAGGPGDPVWLHHWEWQPIRNSTSADRETQGG